MTDDTRRPVGHTEAIANIINICGIERIISDEAVDP